MIQITKITTLIILLVVATVTLQAQKVISFTVGFKIKNFGSTVNGSFKTGAATIVSDSNARASSSFEGYVMANSINTGIKLRDQHLREKENFFEAIKYPKLTMKSVSVDAPNANKVMVTFDLTIKGIVKRIKVPVVIVKVNGQTHYTCDFAINRNDWNIGGKSMSMGDDVYIKLKAVTNH